MSFRVVALGEGDPRALVVLYLVGAHGRQQTIVLPEMLRRHVLPWLTRELGPATVREAVEHPTPIPAVRSVRSLLRRGDRGDDVRSWQERLRAIGYDAGAQAFARQVEEAAALGRGRWHDAAELRRDPSVLEAGLMIFWRRSGWRGHCGVVSRVDGARFWAVEGNSGAAGDRVAEMAHRLDDERLIGAGLPT